MSALAASVFISYSHLDAPLVAPVVALLRANRLVVFRDADTIQPGKRWQAEIDSAIRTAQLVVLFCCRHSHASYEVTYEYRLAMELGKDILPLKLDDAPMPPGLDDYQFIDFRHLAGSFHKDKVQLSSPSMTVWYRIKRFCTSTAVMPWQLLMTLVRQRYSRTPSASPLPPSVVMQRRETAPPRRPAPRSEHDDEPDIEVNITDDQRRMAALLQSAILQRTGVEAARAGRSQ